MNQSNTNRRFGNTVVAIACVILIAGGLVYSLQHGKQPNNNSGRLSVTTTTTLLQCIVKDIGGDSMDINILTAPGSCPGHFDLSPERMLKLSRSKVIMMHGFEQYIPGMLNSLDKKPELVKVPVEGNWLVPDTYLKATDIVTDRLCRLNPRDKEQYRQARKYLQSSVGSTAEAVQQQLQQANVASTVVLCSDQQRLLLEWMGFDVAGTYPRSEEFTPQMLQALAKQGREKRVRLVVDNLQSGPTAGRELARDLGAAHVTLSNFPGGYPNTDTWSACLSDNTARILKAMN